MDYYGIPDRNHSIAPSSQVLPAGKDPLDFDFKEALALPPPSTPSTASSSTAQGSVVHPESSASVVWQRTQHLRPSPKHSNSAPAVPLLGRKPFTMAHSSKAQQQCLKLCTLVSATSDRVAERMTDFAAIARHLPHGWDVLANDLLDTCHVLASIETGLSEIISEGQSLPLDMISVLDKKFRVAQRDLKHLDHMVEKGIEHEKKTGMGRWFSKSFGDGNTHALATTLSRTREDLKMSAYMFHWTPAGEASSDVGIGYIALASALDGKDMLRASAVSMASEETHTAHRPNAIQRTRSIDAHRSPLHHQLHHMPHSNTGSARQEREKGFPTRNESLRTDSGIHPLDEPGSPHTPHTHASGSAFSYFERGPPPSKSALSASSPLSDISQHLPNPELEALCGDLETLDLDSTKVVRIESEPFQMPRRTPRSDTDADKVGAKNALVAAVTARDHRRIAQLLDRGVPPDTGPDGHALNEAVFTQDAESMRLLLSYGADPNGADSHGETPLAAAVGKQFLQGAIALLKYGADPNLSINDSDSPLIIAGRTGNARLVHLLLMYGGLPNQSSHEGNTLLVGSINKKTPLNLVDTLLEYGARPNEKTKDGVSALFNAITSGRADITASLIKHGADPNLPGPKHMLWPSTFQPACLQIVLDAGADTKKAPGIMELATSINNIESVKILLAAGVNPNAKKDGVYTPLCTSIRDDRPDIFRLLLAHGADPNIPASEYPCFKCITHHRLHFLPALVEAGGRLDSPAGILETAVTANDAAAVKWLLDHGQDPDAKAPGGDTPLTSAIRDGRVELVKTLLGRGANPNVRGKDWPVCMAVRHPEILKAVLGVLREPRAFKGIVEMAVHANQLESVKLLLAAGVSVEDRNGGVFSPLTTGLRDRHAEIVAYLVKEAGADVNAPGEHLPIVKALRRCTDEEHVHMIDLLLAKGANPNKVYRGWNGIMQALENGDARMLQKVCEKGGVDLEVQDEMGRNVTEIAISRRWEEAVKILLANAFGGK